MANATTMVAGRSWLKAAARAGYLANGVIYMTIGGLAIGVAIGERGRLGGSETAVRAIGDQSYGRVLLVLTAVGLFAYALWRVVSAIFDPEEHGRDAKGIAVRLGNLAKGILHGALGVLAIQMAMGTRAGGSSSSERTYVTKLLAADGGAIVLGLVGVIVLLYAAHELHEAWTTDFARKLRTGEMSSLERTWATRIGRIGIGARALVFIVVGLGLLRAAFTLDPSNAPAGIGPALTSIARQPFGVFLLLAVAVGLVAYGIHQFTLARYRRIPAPAR